MKKILYNYLVLLVMWMLIVCVAVGSLIWVHWLLIVSLCTNHGMLSEPCAFVVEEWKLTHQQLQRRLVTYLKLYWI
jgi:hypothetical protein